jgi:gliding motility-associated-like protein
MPRNFYILLFVLVLLGPLKAQFPNPLDFNTATNATNTGKIPMGANDLHWTAALTSSTGVYVPAVRVNIVPGWAVSPFPNADWISYPHTCATNPSDHSCHGSVDEYYKLIVNLPPTACGQSVATPSAYCLSFDFFADNWVSEIFVNGVSSFSNPHPNPYGALGFTSGNAAKVSLCNNWIPGANTVIVTVKSGSGWTGFLAQANQTINTTVGNPISVTASQTNVSCYGGNNGIASVTATGGNGTYSYTWLPSGGNTNTATGLNAGSYSVIIASGSCSLTQTFSITQTSPVLISVSAGDTICSGSSATFTASGANSYLWNTGATTSVITANNAGTYTVTGSNSVTGCTGTNTVTLFVEPLPVISIIGNTTVCASQSVMLSASGAINYSWTPGAMTGSSITVAPTVNTTYSVSGANSSGCIGTAATTITISNTIPISITSPSTVICIGETTTLTASGASTYTWLPGNMNTAGIVVSPTSSSTFTVLATFGTCTAMAVQNVSVTPMPTVGISTNATPILCGGSSLILNASGATSYTWMPGNLTGNLISIAPQVTTIYTLTGSTGHCVSQAVQEVTVIPGVNLTASGSQTVCEGTQVILSVQGAATHLWNPGNYSGNTFTVYPNQNTTYTVTGTTGTCTASQTVSISVNPVIAGFTDNSLNVTNLDFVQFINTSLYNSENYWFFSNGENSMGVNPSVRFDDPGTYVACLLVKNTQGCSDTLCKAIRINCSENAVYVPNAFTPNRDDLNDVFRVYVLSQCIEKFSFSVFDRWGEQIFKTDKPEEGWDGTYQGIPVSDNVYAYLIEYTMTNRKAYTKTGHITIIK